MGLRDPQICGVLASEVKAVILTPYRREPERDRNWRFVQAWIRTNYDFPIFESDSPGRVFSPGEARNTAADMAGDWDIAIFHDADTIAHPDAIMQAVKQAAVVDKMVVAGDSHMYCDRRSSMRILQSGVPMFPRPDKFDNTGIYEKPCSGIFAVNRNLWGKVNGYVDRLQGYGYEDLVFLQMCGIFADGHDWIRGHITLHLWHPPAEHSNDTNFNKMVWQNVAKFRRRNDQDGARKYLATLGHTVP